MAVRGARNAVATVFLLSGLILASWLSRLPHVRDHLELTAGELGRLVLIGAVGAVGSLPLAGLIVNRFGPRWTVAGAVLLTSFGGGLFAVAEPLRSPVLVAAGLFAMGYGMGTWDVAMNVEGAEVERRRGRALMPRLHAGFSLGTVLGAGLGAAAAAVELPVSVHIGLAAAVTAAAGVAATWFFLPGQPVPAVAERPKTGLRLAWREPRTLLLGVMVLAFALAEGIANDWLAIGLVDGLRVSNATGALGFAVFVAAMTGFRVVGTVVLDRFGRVRALRASGLLIAAGVLLVVFGGSLPVAFAGAVVWGAGAALGFPVGMSAAADDPARAPARVSVVSSIGYTAFLAGPTLLGWLGDQVGVHRALLVVLGAAAVAVAAASGARPVPAEPRVPAGNRVDVTAPV
ncbi:MAG TPA: MFS transporter [Natronosporangium sp.]